MIAVESLLIRPLLGFPEVVPGTDIAAMIAAAAGEIHDGDIFVVTSKIVSKAEGRVIPAENRALALAEETVRIVASRVSDGVLVTQIVENRLGIVAAAAGIDASNAPEGSILLLPKDPDASARDIAARLRELLSASVGVIISDTMGRPWREGQTDCAIGAGGVRVIEDLRGSVDAEGRSLVVTAPCVADELAAAADLVKGKTSRNPVALVRGRSDLVGGLDLPGARSIVRPRDKDMFRLGADEAWRDGFAAGRAATEAQS
ncbi:coenzyme F420-0:L-glutamate ligase [Microbacterium forte]|uniref:coenzyme F420-0:L-glutamate ligase n=1 Tax=Microbacterium forte TaxID=2982533 RepID=UPI00289314C3|nr:coenzyme F420-0:L-glutamate ligase [Microbacterium sp. A(2022)]